MSLFTDFEDEVIADIARRVKKTGRYTETAELMAKSMREQGYSPAQIQKEVMKYLRADKAYQKAVAENTKAYKEEVHENIKAIVKEAQKAGDTIVSEAGEMSWNSDLSMWAEHGVDLKKPNSMSQLKKAFALQTANELKNLTRTLGFKNANTGTEGILSAYQRELDLAVIKVSTGTFSYDQAVKDCIERLAKSGLRHIDYESGRTYQLDTAVRNAVRTGCSQLAGKIMEENLKSSEQDLVITSQHLGSRPEHAPWQNKVFSYSGKSRKYPDFFKETGYGTVTGLKGANCMHDFYPFWESASVIPKDLKEPDPVMINGKEYTYYQCTQKQRSMERDIRAIKREINACEALGMDSQELHSKLKMKMSEYRKFSDSANMKPKNNRLRSYSNTVDVSKSRTYAKKIKENESRAMKEKAQSLFEVQPLEKGDVVKEVSLYKDLKTSDIGVHALEFIEKNNVSVAVFYNNKSISEMNMEDDYGKCIGKHIYINAKTCKTKKKMVETIIHEATHIEYDIGGDKHSECICDCYALIHRKGKLTMSDLRGIIKSINRRYPEMKWRSSNGNN